MSNLFFKRISKPKFTQQLIDIYNTPPINKEKEEFTQSLIDIHKGKKRKCHNCKHGSNQFKIGKLTHLCCGNIDAVKPLEGKELSPWDALRVFSDTCEKHEFKTK